MPSEDLAITPRNLGAICLKRYCARCFYYLLRMKFHPPYASFGAGIFSSMQKIQEAVVGYYLEKDGCLPQEFAPFCDCCSRVDFPRHWSKFSYQHESGVILYGVPDEIFNRTNGHIRVVDHKTARNKGTADPFHGQYTVQVIGYSNIAEVGLELGEADNPGLLYWEVQDEVVVKNPDDYYIDGGLMVPFIPKPLEIEINYATLVPLLKEALKVWNATSPPDGVAGCNDCKKRDLLFAIEQQIETHDRDLFRRLGNFQDMRNELCSREYGRQKNRWTALEDSLHTAGVMFDDDGMTANWEFLDPLSPTGLTIRD